MFWRPWGSSCFFGVYRMLIGTWIPDNLLTIILLVWFSRNKWFVVDCVFSGVICALFFRLFLLKAIIFLVIVHFLIISFLIFIFLLFVPLFFLWFSSNSLYWRVWFCHSNYILVTLHLLYSRSNFSCARISWKLFRYSCIGFYLRKRPFSYSLEFLGLDC